MTFHEAFRSHVLADSALSLKVRKVSPVVIPESLTMADWPAVEVKRVSGTSLPTLTSAKGWNSVRIRVTVWDSDVANSERIMAGIMSRFDGFNGLLGGPSGVKFATGSFAGPRSVYSPESRMVGMQVDIMGLLDESSVS